MEAETVHTCSIHTAGSHITLARQFLKLLSVAGNKSITENMDGLN